MSRLGQGLLVPRSDAKAAASDGSWRCWARFCYGESAPSYPDFLLIALSYAAFWSTGCAFTVPLCHGQETCSSSGKVPPWLVITANWPLGLDGARCCAHPASPCPGPGPVWPVRLRLRGGPGDLEQIQVLLFSFPTQAGVGTQHRQALLARSGVLVCAGGQQL